MKSISSCQLIQLLVTHQLNGQVRTLAEEADFQLSVPLPTALAAEGHFSSDWDYVAQQKLFLWACDKIRSTPSPTLVLDCISTWFLGTRSLPKGLAFNKTELEGTQCVTLWSHWHNLSLICDLWWQEEVMKQGGKGMTNWPILGYIWATCWSKIE